MTNINKSLIKKLDFLSFNSLNALGIDWRNLIKNNTELEKEYYKYLTLKQQYIIVNADFSQLEIYVLAFLSNDPDLIHAVNSGLDIHSFNTEKVFKLNLKQLEQDLKNAKTQEEVKNAEGALLDFKAKRKTIKALTFSLSYGAGKEKISMDLRIPVQEAQKLIDDFYRTYPKIRKWQEDTLLKAIEVGYLETPFGRRRATPKLLGRKDAHLAFIKEDAKTISKLKKDGEYWTLREEFKTVLNSNIQSVASDMCSLAAHKFKEWIKASKLRANMMFWVHDSIVFSVHIDDAIEAINKCLSVMENEVKYKTDTVMYRAALDVGFNYEWTVEVSRKEWFVEDQMAVLQKKLDESLDLDLNKKIKLVVKSSSSDIMDASTYIPAVRKTKQEYFEAMVEKLGLNVHSPTEYMAMMNSCSIEEYENYFNSELNIEAADD